MERPAPDCREVLAKIYVYLDQQIETVEIAAIERHFADCEDCLHHADFEREFLAIIRRKCTQQRVPAELLERLRARLRED